MDQFVETIIQNILTTLSVETVSEEELIELREILDNLVDTAYHKGYDDGILGFDEQEH